MTIHPRLSIAAVGAALVLAAPAASAQQTSPGARTARQCTVNHGAVSYDANVASTKPENRPFTDTTTQAVKVNNAGNSVPINTTNTTSGNSADVTTGARATVDSSRVPTIPARNSDRNAVRVNVGGGSVPVTDVKTAASKSMAKDTNVTVPVVVIDCTDTTSTRKP